MVAGDISSETELLVIGGGPGGYVAAIRAAQLDVDVTLAEMDAYGGTCLNHGCIPSKAFVSATDRAHEAAAAEHMGVYADPAVDMSEMVSWKDKIVSRLTNGVEMLCKNAGVTLVEGRAQFEDEETARIDRQRDGEGGETIAFDNAVVATGSRPVELPGFSFDGERILSSKDALALDSLPDSLLVVGAGYIGMELATVFQKLDCDVTVIEQLPEALPLYEDDVAEIVRERAADMGVDFAFEHAAEDWEEDGDGLVVTTESEDGDQRTFEAEKCLVAVGRKPVTDTLALEETDVETDDHGFVVTDNEARTNVEGIFAIGDVAGEPMLAHKAFREGEVAAEVVAGDSSTLDDQVMPAAVFTDPEIGTVGMTQSEADEAGLDPVVGQMPLRASGRALTLDDTDGFVRVVADEGSGVVLGGQIVGPDASEMVAEIALAIEMGATLEDVATTVHVHPTLSEAVHEAVKGAAGHSIHY
jgi:dihydrolipoamide dehydrogenase